MKLEELSFVNGLLFINIHTRKIFRFENVLIVLSILFKFSQSDNALQCSQEDFNLENYPACLPENSCILRNLNTSNVYAIDRTIHEFKCLIFVDSFIPEIPSNIFMTLKSNISHLYANNVNISELRRISFPFAQKLKSVDLSWNLIQNLNEMIFYDAPNLVSLNLSHNSIAEFSSNVFDKLDSLQVLDMSYNQITTIPFDLFLPLDNLVELNLRYNRLQLKFGIFPENLHSLDLSYNNLEIQQKFKIFSLLQNLILLLLHGNRIESIHQSIFNSHLRFLGLSENLFSCTILADIILAMQTHNIVPLVENSVKHTSNIYGIKCIE